MPLSDFLKTLLSRKWKKFPFEILQGEDRKKYKDYFLTLAIVDKDVAFFCIHDDINEAKNSFSVLNKGRWAGFSKGDSRVFILLYDLYEDKILKEITILFKGLSNSSVKSHKNINASLEK